MRIKLKDNLSGRPKKKKKKIPGYLQCWVKGSLGHEEPQPSSCPARGLGCREQRMDGVSTMTVVLSSPPFLAEGLDQAELSILSSSTL